MKKITRIILFLILIINCNIQLRGQNLHNIPEQQLELNNLMGIKDDHFTDTIKAFEISDFITYVEYKNYLQSVKVDSSEQFYLTQLPDTNITINKSAYKKYIISKEYDKFPVLGISWENAMNYCRWMTLRENKNEKIDFIYRLPRHSEWLAALNYYELNDIDNDFDQKYSDWLLNTFDESVYNFQRELGFDYEYLHKKNDPPVLKRKKIIGESYLYNMPSHLESYPRYRYGYSYIGYQQISFRIVKIKAEEYILKYWGIEK